MSSSPQSGQSAVGDARRVVLADDTPDVREFVRLILERAGGFEVVGEAANGAEAVAACETHRPDLIVLDLAMPVMDGLEAIPRIRQVSPATNVVILSGFEASRAANEALELGAVAYIAKGTRPDDLVAKLRSVSVPGASDVVPLFQEAQRAERRAADHSGLEHTRRQSDLVPVLTHELRNQILVIEGFASMMLDTWEDLPPAQKVEFVQRIARNAVQMHGLVDAFSDANKIDSENLELMLVATDVGVLVREVASDLATLSDSHSIEIDTPDDVLIPLDPVRVRQVLTNLLSNAAKFSLPGSTIHVGVETTKRHVEIVVADEGPGIPPARRDELFRPFSRLGVTDKNGSGLGLYISRGIARAHQGDLILAPSPLGACFVLMLPLH